MRKITPVIVLTSLLFVSLTAMAGPARIPKRPVRGATLSRLLTSAHRTRSSAYMDRYLKLTAREKDPLLYKFALGAVLKKKPTMTAPQQKVFKRLLSDPGRGLLPKRPLIPRKGPIEVRYFVGPEFFKEEVGLLSKQGFKVKDHAQGKEATRGRVHVLVRKGSNEVFRDLKDSKVHAVIYSGHSNLGGVVERGLKQANLGLGRGAKLVALLQCSGTQTLPLLATRMPRAQIVTTFNSSYPSADQAVIKTLFNGLEGRWTYAKMESTVRKQYHGSNYLFPNQVEQLKHTDFDKNGMLDGAQFATKGPKFSGLTPRAMKGAQRLVSGVHYLRTMNPYYAAEERSAVFSRSHADSPVIASGVVKGNGKSALHITDTRIHGARAFKVALDAKMATAPKALVGASTVYELQLHMQKTLLGKSDQRSRVRALAFAGEYLQRMYPGEKGEKALGRLTKRYGFRSLRLNDMPRGVHGLSESSIDRLAAKVAPPSPAPTPAPIPH